MDRGIDSGLIFHQFLIAVVPGDTACSLYRRVCAKSGKDLADVVQWVKEGLVQPKHQREDLEVRQWSWPDQEHRWLMANSKRRFMNFLDFWRILGANA